MGPEGVIAAQAKLMTEGNAPHQLASNKDYVCDFICSSLLTQFGNLNRVQVEAFVIKLFNTLHDWKEFKDTLRDLLISMKSYASQNNEFYEEEKLVSLKQEFALVRANRICVSVSVRPHLKNRKSRRWPPRRRYPA